MSDIEYAPNGKIILRLIVEAKPIHPGFACSLCEQHRDIWEVSYKNDLGTWLCNKCTLDGLNRVQGPSYYSQLSWLECKAIDIARSITHELKNGRRHGRTIDGGSPEPRGANHGAGYGLEGIARGEDISPRRSRPRRTSPTSPSWGSLRGDCSEIYRQPSEADSGLTASSVSRPHLSTPETK